MSFQGRGIKIWVCFQRMKILSHHFSYTPFLRKFIQNLARTQKDDLNISFSPQIKVNFPCVDLLNFMQFNFYMTFQNYKKNSYKAIRIGQLDTPDEETGFDSNR